ncbi:MAG TPA: FAD-binding protein [Vicinamibacterales bacterium]
MNGTHVSPAAVARPSSIPDVQEAVRAAGDVRSAEGDVRPVGGRTKTALSTPRPGDLVLDLSGLSGVLEYEPDECTFTALAGTPLRDVEAMLAQHGQALPFEAPFASRGATLGGVVASGLNGPGRYRYGGIRDFLIGARFVDGDGRLLRGGGKVVKNAAGFYLHHLLLGSAGRLGTLVELTFKVFPAPRARLTLVARYPSLADALAQVVSLRQSSYELDALDVAPDGRVWVRIAGEAAALDARAATLTGILGGSNVTREEPAAAEAFWTEARDCAWAQHGILARVATTPSALAGLDAALGAAGAGRRYSAGGEIAWVDWPGDSGALDRLLQDRGLSGLLVLGSGVEDPIVGVRPDPAFMSRVKSVLDRGGTYAGSRK